LGDSESKQTVGGTTLLWGY